MFKLTRAGNLACNMLYCQLWRLLLKTMQDAHLMQNTSRLYFHPDHSVEFFSSDDSQVSSTAFIPTIHGWL